MTIIANLSDLVIEQVSVTNDVVVTACAASPTASCPCCGMISQRVHSHYQRTLRDLPASGRPVHLVLQVRRFFCEEQTCLLPHPHAWWGWMIGHGNADCAMER